MKLLQGLALIAFYKKASKNDIYSTCSKEESLTGDYNTESLKISEALKTRLSDLITGQL